MFCKSCGNQIAEEMRFCTKCGTSVEAEKTPKKTTKFFTKKKLIILGVIVAVIAVAIAAFAFYETDKESVSATDRKDQEIASSVVNIYCTGKTDEDTSGGSGTILTEEGLILTNAHIIPEGAEDTVSCLVILPDPTTGSPDEIYTAYPIIVPKLSEEYDLAFVKVDDVFYDHEEGKAYGEYPKVFPAYDPNKYCKSEDVKLGESVRIYGYPAISGGYALTITDGVVSSLMLDEGLIFTSAKISHGNSGGLAVDKNGCRIGVPAMVNGDENESLGIIISNDLIYEFMGEIKTVLDAI
ncbi:MAG: trypsin-like peptidase domain-containing protein [Minisyncoccota bacterium]